jgi:hypothetical protein
MVGTPAARHCQGMSRDPTRRAHGGTTDPQLIVAVLALIAALVLVILAF